MNNLPKISALVWRLLFAAALVAVCLMSEARASDSRATECGCASTGAHFACIHTAQRPSASWLFARSRYTHDPDTGGRVAQYAMKPPVEPLPDQRAVTSGYTRNRTVQRGADGSANTSYRVQSYGNGRGGLDAEWERFHDAWRGSTLAGGNFQSWGQSGFGAFGGNGSFPAYGPGNMAPGGTFPSPLGQPGFYSRPHYGPGYSAGNGFPSHGFPAYGGPRLDPDGADGYRDGNHRTPDRQFFNQAVPMPRQPIPVPTPAPAPRRPAPRRPAP